MKKHAKLLAKLNHIGLDEATQRWFLIFYISTQRIKTCDCLHTDIKETDVTFILETNILHNLCFTVRNNHNF